MERVWLDGLVGSPLGCHGLGKQQTACLRAKPTHQASALRDAAQPRWEIHLLCEREMRVNKLVCAEILKQVVFLLCVY